MSTPFLAEIKLISFNFPPRGWAFCNGQLMPINQNQALFSILGTTYGGDGMRTFGLPNLQGRVPIHVGSGIVLGEQGGETTHTLNTQEMPAHSHAPVGTTASADQAAPGVNLWAVDNYATYVPTPNAALNPTIQNAGGSQPHENMPPYLVLNFVIALQGIFPSQT